MPLPYHAFDIYLNSIKVALAVGHLAFGHTNTMQCFA